MLNQKQKLSPLSINQKIDYKDIDLLKLFVTEQGKFYPVVPQGLQYNNNVKLQKQ